MTTAEQLKLLTRNAVEIAPSGELEKKLNLAKKKKRPLVVKLGLDPTAPDIHLGHAVVLRKLREFQDCGHQVVLIVGDFTAMIGDPSGRSATRPVLSAAQIKKNAATYKKQAEKILDSKKLTIRFNSEWLGKLKAQDLLTLMSKVTVSQMLVRQDFRSRLNLEDNAEHTGSELGFHEMLYPLLQGYDSVMIKADVEIGGTDQTVNLMMGRRLQQKLGEEAQACITMPLIAGTDGKKKMSKSLGNYIGITEAAESIYGKVMSLPDTLLFPYFRLLTDLTEEEVAKKEEEIRKGKNPMEVKKELALILASMYSSKAAAEKAAAHWEKTFQKGLHMLGDKDAQVLEISEGATLLELCSKEKLFSSNSEARRKIQEGAIDIDGVKVTDPYHVLRAAKGQKLALRVGKHRFYTITITH